MAEAGGAIFIDLANDAWEAIEITASGWRVETEPPTKFRRPPGMLALPSPVAGGRLAELQPLMNLATPQDWIVPLAWLVAALRPRGSYPVLLLYGERGTGKSTVARFLRTVLDPSSTPLRAKPRGGRNLMTSPGTTGCSASTTPPHSPPACPMPCVGWSRAGATPYAGYILMRMKPCLKPNAPSS